MRRHACRAAFAAGRLDHVGLSVLPSAEAGEDAREVERDTLRALAPADRVPILQSWLRALVAAGLRVASSRIATAEPLGKVGMDSLAAVELRHRVEARLGPALPPDASLQDLTIAQLAAELAARVDAPAPSENSARHARSGASRRPVREVPGRRGVLRRVPDPARPLLHPAHPGRSRPGPGCASPAVKSSSGR